MTSYKRSQGLPGDTKLTCKKQAQAHDGRSSTVEEGSPPRKKRMRRKEKKMKKRKKRMMTKREL
ncbi:unnamed protein product [Coregonus sp. 'balchen']|nr:unnamed protein product [Coregonus sp. 'balchen']